MTMIVRGLDIRVAPPFGKPLSEALTVAATAAPSVVPDRSALFTHSESMQFQSDRIAI
jgi:hypothetical protein